MVPDPDADVDPEADEPRGAANAEEDEEAAVKESIGSRENDAAIENLIKRQ